MPKRLSNRRSCVDCRRLHLKCNGQQPCESCVQAGRKCISATDLVQFRHDHNPSVERTDKGASGKRLSSPGGGFRKDHVWTNVPSKLTFIQQDKASILAECEIDWGEKLSQASRNQSPAIEKSTQCQRMAVSAILTPTSSSTGVPYTPSPSYYSHGDDKEALLPPPKLWPITNRNEAMLICYFVKDIAPLFDFMDQNRHFETSVARAASFHEITKYAVYAISAKMLSTTGKWDPLSADRYQSQCLQLFIPAILKRHPHLQNDMLCAATLILRVYDQMTGQDPSGGGRSTRKHVLDTDVIVRAQEPGTPGYSLCQAALFVAMRQELYLVAYTCTPPPPLAMYGRVSRSIEQVSTDSSWGVDGTWARRMLAHTEDVARFVYGQEQRTVEKWDELSTYLDQWLEHRPPPFDPMWTSGDENHGFPEMWYADDCHVAGQQYVDICRILLALYDPRIPSTGLERLSAAREVDEAVTRRLRRILGIAMSNKRFPAAMSTAGMAIVICGDRLTDKAEQRVALEILEQYENMVQWPSLRAQDRLRRLWDL